MSKVKKPNPYDGITTYTKKERNMYLIGLAGQNVIYNIVGTGLQFYFESVIFMPALAVGIIMALARVWDAFNDPMMGTFVDKTRTKYGKCRPWLMIAPGIIFVVTILCFTNFGIYTDSEANKSLIVIWAAITYVLWGMSYTVGDIPLWGITAVMSTNEEHRNKLLSLARAAAGAGGAISLVAIVPVGQAIGTALANSRFAHLSEADALIQGNRYGFLIAAVIFSIIGCGTFQLVGIFTRERIKGSEEKNSIVENFKLMWNNKPFRQLLISGILASPKQIIMLIAMTLVNIYYANGDGGQVIKYYAILGAGLFLGQFAIMLVIPSLLKHFEKKTLYNLSNLISAVPFAMIYVCYALAPDNNVNTPLFLAIYAVMFAFAGVSLGATSVLQSSMIADCVDYEEYNSGLRPDGVFFSGQSFITKLSTGIATIITSLGYLVVDFQTEKREAVMVYMNNGAGPLARENPEFAPFMAIMFFLISIPPAIGCVLTVIPTLKYALPDKEHKRILAELNERRAAESK